MMKPGIYVTRHLDDAALKKLAQTFEVTLNPEDRQPNAKEIVQGIQNKDALLCLLTDTIDKSILDAASRLKVISNYAVGFNNIDIQEASKRKIAVCTTPGILTNATADLTWALILSVTRRIVEADQFTRAGLFTGWEPNLFLGSELEGKTLGIIGMGRIGQAVAKRAKGFGMKIVYCAKSQKKFDEALSLPLPEILQVSDIISLHTPLTPETRHLLSTHEFKLMKKKPYIINTTRGAVVDEKALILALKENLIAGAGLDVYEHEPHFSKELTEFKNVVMLPHIGSATIETRSKMAFMAVENAISIIEGKKPHSIVNPEVLTLSVEK